MRLAVFFKLFKTDRAAAAVAAPVQAEVADPGEGASASQDDTAAAVNGGRTLTGVEKMEASARAAVAEAKGVEPGDEAVAASGLGDVLKAANTNVEADVQADVEPVVKDPTPRASAGIAAISVITGADGASSDAASPAAASSNASASSPTCQATSDVTPFEGPIGQERALADVSRAASVGGPGFHIAVVASADLLAGEAIRAVVANSVPRSAPVVDWVYVHNFDDASRPRALALPAGEAPTFAAAVHDAVAEALAALATARGAEERIARRRSIDAETRDALEDRLLAIKTRAEMQNLAVLRTPNGYVVAPVHEGKVVKPEVFARLPEAMRVDVEARVRSMQDELAAALAERPAVERERRRRLVAADTELARAAVKAAFADVVAAFGADAATARHLAALGDALVAEWVERADGTAPATPDIAQLADRAPRGIPRRTRVNVFHSSAATAEPSDAARVVDVTTQASAAMLVGHARRGERDHDRAVDHLDLACGAAHRAGGGVLLVDAGRLAHFADGATALDHLLATSEIAIEDAAPSLLPEPIPLTARVVLVGDRDGIDQLARIAPGLLARLRGTAHCDETMSDTDEAREMLARRMAAAVALHDLVGLDATAVAGLVDLSRRMAGEGARLSCRIAPLIDVAREADVLARRDGRQTMTRADIDAAASARERSLAALGGAAVTRGARR